MTNHLKNLLGARYLLVVLRLVLAIACFVIATILAFIPGPAFLFWIFGFIFLGYGAGEILLSFQRVQDWMRAHVPLWDRIPPLRDRHIRYLMRNSWVRWLDRLSASRERRRLTRAERRAARAARKAERRARGTTVS